MAAISAIESLYGTPEIRMRAASQPVEGKGGTLLGVGEVQLPSEAIRAGAAGPANFGELLAAGVQRTAELGHVAEVKAQAFAAGAFDDLHGTMISAKEAEISLRLVGSVRTKLLDAFHELWRINV